MSNAAGNTNRDVRRFLRESGVKPTAANVDRIGREVRRSQTQNETVERISREIGAPSPLEQRAARAREEIRRRIEQRDRQR